jgi:phage gp36-like protein
MTLPMSYCAVTDVFATLPFVNSSTNVTSAVVAHHGGRVQSIINAKLAARYAVPFSPVPPIIETIQNDLTCYFVLAGNTIMANSLKDSPWPAVYKDQMQMLNDIASGKILMTTGSGTVISQSTEQSLTQSSNEAYQPTFWEGDPEITFIDPQKEKNREF